MASIFIFLTKIALIFVIHHAVDATETHSNCNVNETTGVISIFKDQLTNINCTSSGSKVFMGIVLWYLDQPVPESPLKILDDKDWTALNCEAGNSELNETEEVTLCVHGPSDPPQLMVPYDLVPRRSTTITCLITNVYPAPKIEWFLGSEVIAMNASLHNYDNSTSLFNASSSLSFTPKSEDHGQNLTCSVLPSVPNVWTPKNTSVELNISDDSDQFAELRVEDATASSLFLSWQLDQGNVSSMVTLRYCRNGTLDLEGVGTSDNLTCPLYKEVNGLNGTNYNLTGLAPFQWYDLTLLADGSPNASETASTAPPLPEYYGVYMTYSPEEDTLKISKLPVMNRTVPSDLCFAIQTQDQKPNCSSSSVECKVPNGTEVDGVHGEQIKGIGLISSGRGFCSLPSQPVILNSTHGKMDMPHVSIIMGAVLGTSISILLSSVALLLLLNFICKGISCLGKKEEDINEDETLVRVIRKDNSRKVDKDGLVYVEIAHNNTHPADAPPIRTEEPTVYALLDAGAMGTYKKDDDGLVYVEVSHDHAHPPGAPPIQTEKPTVYASLDMEAMATRKEREEKEEEKVEEKEEEKEEKSGVKDEKEGVNNERKSVQKETEGVKEETEGVKEEKEKVKEVNENDKKAPEEQSPPITKLPNYENITLTEDDGLALPSTLETRL